MKLLSLAVKVWLSKSFTNFAGTSHWLHQQGKWKSREYRYYEISEEINIFHMFTYQNQLLDLEWQVIFKALFNFLAK